MIKSASGAVTTGGVNTNEMNHDLKTSEMTFNLNNG